MRWLWLAVTGALWSWAGFLGSSLEEYLNWSAVIFVTFLVGGALTATAALRADEKLCRPGPVSLTPVKSPAVPSLEQLTQLGNRYALALLDIDHVVKEQLEKSRQAKAAELMALEPKEDEYVASGQAELSADLLEIMRAQAREAFPRQRKYKYPHKGCWRMSPEWAAEVRRLHFGGGEITWQGPGFLLLGYQVKVSEEYGVPELTLDP